MDQIKAIETHYNGYRFRSRLEARWAVFFDAAGIKYEYEPEGFTLQNGLCYLPDFYLPEENVYVEVKPPRKGAWKEIQKASHFVGNQITCLLLLSNIPEYGPHTYYFPVLYFHPVEQELRIRHVPFSGNDELDRIFLCRTYNDPFPRAFELFGFDYFRTDEERDAACKELLKPLVDEDEYSIENVLPEDAIFCEHAYSKARQARFENGEKG